MKAKIEDGILIIWPEEVSEEKDIRRWCREAEERRKDERLSERITIYHTLSRYTENEKRK